MYFISVIIPAYNRGHIIGLTLNSFINQNYPKDKYEIIVVDNNSSDNTAEVVKKVIFKSNNLVRYILEPKQGVHFARNTAAKLAKGDILYYTDDDMIADNNLLIEMAQLFETDDRIGSATGKVLPKWERKPPDWIVKYCNNYLLSLNDIGNELIISHNDIGVFSCHQAMRKEVFMKSGGFNPENTMGEWIGDGETGLNIKIKSLGYKFAYSPRAIIFHMIPVERMTQEYLNKRLKNQGNSDSYTDYRANKISYSRFLLSLFSYIKLLLLNTIWHVGLRVKKNDYWRLRRARVFYYLARIKYDIRLIYDSHFREMVLRTDWLND